ncbi:GFA family protein [Aestuariirhabdus sp. Z084]|uniref:GFA family protein n=1 Tax=Aestuariirhabdus haliotis TaxID=2918751 RepID=UPI00201B3B3E|nr:GFA family protein [Aestuariirhabdus haliotis]MCL6414088.1 GFA family protein [Aestuariirhabdus haliotis]MCL6418020.1 GFA family protein [Aestuariirhabdus haliotis]
MKLAGSCHCGAIHFTLDSAHPYPFNRCYCSICRKTAGGGGYAINLGGDAASMSVEGREHLSVYQASIEGQTSPAERYFCRHCGSALWVYDERWPKLIHPFASAIDSPLPVPPETTHLMLSSRASWVPVAAAKADLQFDHYPEESIAQWHQRLGLSR